MKINLSGQSKLFSTNEKILIFLLLLSFMGVYGYTLHLMFIAFAAFCFFSKRLTMPAGAVPMVLLSLGMILTAPLTFSPSTLMTQLVWLPAYLLGFGLVNVSSDAQTAEKKLNRYLLVGALGFFIHIALNVYKNWGVDDIYRNTLDFWSGETLAATGQAGFACLPMGLCVAHLFKNTTFKAKIPALIALVIILYYNLTLGSRTIVLSMLILFAVMLIALLITNRSDKRRSRILWMLLAMAVVIGVIYILDLFGLRTLVEDSVLANRLTGENTTELKEDARWDNKLKYLKLMPKHLWGGSHIYDAVGSHAHDVLLDTYDMSGPLALAAVIAILWDSVSKLIRLLKMEHIRFDTKAALICVYFAIFIIFAVEPVLEGLPWLLMTFCFYHGAVTALTWQPAPEQTPE